MNIRTKLSVMAAAAIVLVVLMGAASLFQMRQVYLAASDTRSVWLPRTQMLDDIQFSMLRYHTTTIRKVLATDPREIKSLDDEFVEMDAGIPKRLADYAATINTPQEQALWEAYKAKWNGYLAGRKPIVDALQRGDRSAATAAVDPARAPLVASFEALGSVINFNTNGAGLSAETAGHAYTLSWILTLVLAVFGIAINTGFAGWISRSVSVPIAIMAETMRNLAAGRLDLNVPFVDRGDEIGGMAQAVQSFKHAAVEKIALEKESALAAQEADRRKVEGERKAALAARQAFVEAVRPSFQALAGGDLTARLDAATNSDFAEICELYNSAIATLESTITSVIGSVVSIRSGLGEIAVASNELSQRTEQQAASLEETVAALSEVARGIDATAGNAGNAQGKSSEVQRSAEKGSEVVGRAVEAMAEIEGSSRRIEQIISVIDEIAFQTNLLALNACVEAARAGEAGRGFAVVAQEVRGLAQRSADAAKEIKALISASSMQVARGVDLVSASGRSLEEILSGVSQMNHVITEIARSANEQAGSMKDVSTAADQIDKVTQQNAATVEETTGAVQTLSTATDDLSALVERFRTRQAATSSKLRPASSGSASRAVPQLKTSGRGGAAPRPAPDEWTDF